MMSTNEPIVSVDWLHASLGEPDIKLFDGVAPEPREGIRSGHVPGSKCIPFNQMLDDSQSISLDRPIVISCGTGVTACIVALVSSLSLPNHLGTLYKIAADIPVYDGSWTEWVGNPDVPMVPSEILNETNANFNNRIM
ncbi:transferase [Lithospermum erythrorhizon]|uniref:Transferase n=1 Tax=Lithospermum erythrorhizon TaxID=34254 RepID=A0AAV3Q9I1_LITER